MSGGDVRPPSGSNDQVASPTIESTSPHQGGEVTASSSVSKQMGPGSNPLPASNASQGPWMSSTATGLLRRSKPTPLANLPLLDMNMFLMLMHFNLSEMPSLLGTHAGAVGASRDQASDPRNSTQRRQQWWRLSDVRDCEAKRMPLCPPPGKT